MGDDAQVPLDQAVPMVFPITNATVVRPGAGTVLVRLGSHWWRDDPVVQANLHLFSEDGRWGMEFTQEPPGLDPSGSSMRPTLAGTVPEVLRAGAPEPLVAQPTRGHRAGVRRAV